MKSNKKESLQEMSALERLGEEPLCGIITVANWTMAPTGETFLYFWAKCWVVITDKMMPIDSFKSSEKWTLMAIVDDKAVMLLPGCQVKGFMHAEQCPKLPNLCEIGKSSG